MHLQLLPSREMPWQEPQVKKLRRHWPRSLWSSRESHSFHLHLPRDLHGPCLLHHFPSWQPPHCVLGHHSPEHQGCPVVETVFCSAPDFSSSNVGTSEPVAHKPLINIFSLIWWNPHVSSYLHFGSFNSHLWRCQSRPCNHRTEDQKHSRNIRTLYFQLCRSYCFPWSAFFHERSEQVQQGTWPDLAFSLPHSTWARIRDSWSSSGQDWVIPDWGSVETQSNQNIFCFRFS